MFYIQKAKVNLKQATRQGTLNIMNVSFPCLCEVCAGTLIVNDNLPAALTVDID